MAYDSFDKPIRPRTSTQNRALHKYFEEVADVLNESGITQDVFFKDIEVDYTKETIKHLWRCISKKKFGKESTADLTTTELQEVYEEMNRHVSKFGFHIPFPSYAADYDEEFLKKNGII
jgi:hypothetical protein